jgi:hypothetical protein
MPALFEYDPRRWARILDQVGKAMVEQGWNPKARKFDEVRRRRAMRIMKGSQ